MTSSSPEQQLIDYIKRRILKDDDATVDIDTALVSSGLIDSFSLVEVLQEVEVVGGLRIPAGKVQPEDLDTVRSMLQLVSRLRTT